jgi:hypothetical protein
VALEIIKSKSKEDLRYLNSDLSRKTSKLHVENKRNWGGENWLYRMGAMVIKAFIWILGLETNIHPGYDIMYVVAKLFVVLLSIDLLVRFVPWRRHIIPWVQKHGWV